MKRTSFVRVVPAAIEWVDWDQLEGKKENGNGRAANGDGQRTLFEE